MKARLQYKLQVKSKPMKAHTKFDVPTEVLYNLLGDKSFTYTRTINGVEQTEDDVVKLCEYFYNLGKKNAFGQSNQTAALLDVNFNRKESN